MKQFLLLIFLSASLITFAQTPYDCSIEEVYVADTTSLHYNTPVHIKIKNEGSDTLKRIPLKFIAGSNTVNGTWLGTLAPNQTAIYCFPQALVTPLGCYVLMVEVDTIADTNTANNSISSYNFGSVYGSNPDLNVSINAPYHLFNNGDSHQVSIQLTNTGDLPVGHIPLSIYCNQTLVANEIAFTDLHSSQSTYYTFNSPIVMQSGPNKVTVVVHHPGDNNTANDTSTHTFIADSSHVDLAVAFLSSDPIIDWTKRLVKMRLYNQGSSPLANIPLSYVVNGSFTSEVLTQTIQPGDSLDYTFNQPYLTPNGHYQLVVIGLCPNDMDTLNNTDTVYLHYLALEDKEMDFSISKLYPNPSNGNFSIDCKVQNACDLKLRVFNILGDAVYTSEHKLNKGNNRLQVKLNKLPSAVYYVQLESNKGKESRKIVVY